ncbi:sugar ABC transporter ATP-binding protein [Extibacter muris]|uniref:sugar ABC transporter ATP-binding protein n=1 Tax=Extibacter muris TaxID=1796622 RepID=UPI001D069FF3|nr:sugar ABC transporter ATP-binding protein [Extibacter muris]MCB6202005.1 sugar ABC transporter ATP-binding protein [Extibacter muris]MCQ4663322.1 sugar ABC transporter ATP-binding protein [Extibacter muris]MCQ4692638.1 sugar ABC transporter ATP-binding protein [Extibacter muris]
MEPILRVEGLTKEFPGVKALDNVKFDLCPGEVHILVGENGAGKSTLAKCILGAYEPEEGRIFLEGRQVNFKTPKEALANGIAAVYQELTMIPHLNAAQNIFFNREPVYKGGRIINQKLMQRQAKEILKTLNCEGIDTTKPVKYLGVAEQQMIEIAKAISIGPKIIVFDEPTATLSDREVESFFQQIKLLKKRNIGIIYVSHRMKEFHHIGDRITVLRDGKYIATLKEGELSDEELVNLMVGRDIAQVYVRTPNEHTGEALKVEHVSDRAGKVRDCSLVVNRGEIVGLAGLVGAGRTELARLIFGIDKLKSGKVWLHGEDVTGRPPKSLVREGLGLLPEDRKQLGLAVRAPISWNIAAVSLKQLFPHFFLRQGKNDEIAREYVETLKIATPSVKKMARALSGGNQQKVVIAKWLSANTDVILFDEPTRGIDVGAKMEIYALMDRLASEGKAILMISSEMQEIIGMSDRMYIMNNGSVAGHIERKEFAADKIGQMMLLGS